jgi:hypothetical protein
MELGKALLDISSTEYYIPLAAAVLVCGRDHAGIGIARIAGTFLRLETDVKTARSSNFYAVVLPEFGSLFRKSRRHQCVSSRRGFTAASYLQPSVGDSESTASGQK